jgi:hypothetical protein
MGLDFDEMDDLPHPGSYNAENHEPFGLPALPFRRLA